MNPTKIAIGIKSICELMQSADCNELVMDIGLNGAENDGARFVFHVIRQCPELAVEEEDSEEESENES